MVRVRNLSSQGTRFAANPATSVTLFREMRVEEACDMELSFLRKKKFLIDRYGPWQSFALQAPSIARPPDVLANVQTLLPRPHPRLRASVLAS